MAHWLFKSEPGVWSWDDQVKKGAEKWDGVRNHTAKQNMMAMKRGDRAFFYHSGGERQIVGIVEVAREAYPDPGDPTGTFVMVDIKAVKPVKTPVTLSAIKADPRLKDMKLVRQGRLSVSPVTDAEWKILCKAAGVEP
ncbi:MAG TPA: EVE domain-containing protein [Alphaproteobacteria bacterium]|jgi:predicted RNA-binding protein with PUA-like domain|nr:EVE domain-containing protein [Alphaproteobacteria bacterium]